MTWPGWRLFGTGCSSPDCSSSQGKPSSNHGRPVSAWAQPQEQWNACDKVLLTTTRTGLSRSPGLPAPSRPFPARCGDRGRACGSPAVCRWAHACWHWLFLTHFLLTRSRLGFPMLPGPGDIAARAHSRLNPEHPACQAQLVTASGDRAGTPTRPQLTSSRPSLHNGPVASTGVCQHSRDSGGCSCTMAGVCWSRHSVQTDQLPVYLLASVGQGVTGLGYGL